MRKMSRCPGYYDWLVLGLLLAIAGCASSPPNRFYLLAPLSKAERPAATAPGDGPVVGVGPVDLPAYLDRPQIVTRVASNEFKLSEFERWSEPVKDNFVGVLAENLSILIPTDRIFEYPWKRADQVQYQVVADVIRFDRDVDGDSVLRVRWRLLDGQRGQELLARNTTYTAQPGGADYPATVAAMNQTLTDFSRDIAAAIRKLPAAGQQGSTLRREPEPP